VTKTDILRAWRDGSGEARETTAARTSE
jgi:hypothetical protein